MANAATATGRVGNAFQTPVSFLRYRRSMPWNYDLQNRKNEEMLYRTLNLGTTVAFLGAGCSYEFVPLKWIDFAQEAVVEAWVSLHQEFQASEEHTRHYKEKIVEFARQLQMQSTDLSMLPSMSGSQRGRVDSLIQR